MQRGRPARAKALWWGKSWLSPQGNAPAERAREARAEGPRAGAGRRASPCPAALGTLRFVQSVLRAKSGAWALRTGQRPLFACRGTCPSPAWGKRHEGHPVSLRQPLTAAPRYSTPWPGPRRSPTELRHISLRVGFARSHPPAPTRYLEVPGSTWK